MKSLPIPDLSNHRSKFKGNKDNLEKCNNAHLYEVVNTVGGKMRSTTMNSLWYVKIIEDKPSILLLSSDPTPAIISLNVSVMKAEETYTCSNSSSLKLTQYQNQDKCFIVSIENSGGDFMMQWSTKLKQINDTFESWVVNYATDLWCFNWMRTSRNGDSIDNVSKQIILVNSVVNSTTRDRSKSVFTVGLQRHSHHGRPAVSKKVTGGDEELMLNGEEQRKSVPIAKESATFISLNRSLKITMGWNIADTGKQSFAPTRKTIRSNVLNYGICPFWCTSCEMVVDDKMSTFPNFTSMTQPQETKHYKKIVI
uniref:Uncharacterized protein n=1 Tax=Romanomermis culicivorax TaxID=13658 RepID=A0A915IT81_ROMCU